MQRSEIEKAVRRAELASVKTSRRPGFKNILYILLHKNSNSSKINDVVDEPSYPPYYIPIRGQVCLKF